MEPPHALVMTDRNSEITAAVLRESSRLAAYIRRRVRDVGDAEDLLQGVLHEFVRAYRLPEPIEQASAWLVRVARNRIIDRFRRRRAQPDSEPLIPAEEDGAARLDFALPSSDSDPEIALARSLLLDALQDALDELPIEQREVFIANEIDGISFKDMAKRSGIPLNTLLGRKRYAVLHLRSRLQPLYDEWDL
jgi:RNA polymerase sigma factor (sigma-70 family)